MLTFFTYSVFRPNLWPVFYHNQNKIWAKFGLLLSFPISAPLLFIARVKSIVNGTKKGGIPQFQSWNKKVYFLSSSFLYKKHSLKVIFLKLLKKKNLFSLRQQTRLRNYALLSSPPTLKPQKEISPLPKRATMHMQIDNIDSLLESQFFGNVSFEVIITSPPHHYVIIYMSNFRWKVIFFMFTKKFYVMEVVISQQCSKMYGENVSISFIYFFTLFLLILFI